MKYCSKCGAACADDSKFCTVCGYKFDAPETSATAEIDVQTGGNPSRNAADGYMQQPGYTQQPEYAQQPEYTQPSAAPQPVKKKKKLSPLAIIGIVFGSLIVVLGATAAILLSQPKNKVMLAMVKTGIAVAASEPVQDTIAYINGGSLELKTGGEQTEIPYGNWTARILTGSDSSFKLYADAGKRRMALEGNIGIGKSGIDFKGVLDENHLAVSSNLLGKQAYGLGLRDMKENLQNSIFNPMRNGYYGIDQGLYETLMNVDISGGEAALSENGSRIRKVSADFALTLMDSLFKNGKVKEKTEKLEFGENDVKTDLVELKFTPKTAAKVSKDLYTWARKNSDLKSLVRDLDKKVPLGYSGYTVSGVFDNVLDELQEDSYEDAWNFETMYLNFYISKSNGQLICLEFAPDYTSTYLKIGPDAKDARLIEIGYDLYGDTGRFAWEVPTDSGKEYEWVLNLDGEKANFYWDKEDESFTFSADGVKIYGKYKKSGTNMQMMIDKVAAGGESIPLNLMFALKTGEKQPEINDYKDIFSITSEKEMDALVENVKESLWEAFGSMY